MALSDDMLKKGMELPLNVDSTPVTLAPPLSRPEAVVPPGMAPVLSRPEAVTPPGLAPMIPGPGGNPPTTSAGRDWTVR